MSKIKRTYKRDQNAILINYLYRASRSENGYNWASLSKSSLPLCTVCYTVYTLQMLHLLSCLVTCNGTDTLIWANPKCLKFKFRVSSVVQSANPDYKSCYRHLWSWAHFVWPHTKEKWLWLAGLISRIFCWYITTGLWPHQYTVFTWSSNILTDFAWLAV